MAGLGTNAVLGSRAIIGELYQRLETSPDSWISKLGMLFNSNQESETYNWLGMSPVMREWVGGRQAKGLRHEGITIKNKTFEATLEISIDDLRRDKTGQIMVRIDDLARRTNSHWLSLLTTLITSGTSTDCYDGQYFFDSDHVSGSSGTLTNLLTATQVTSLNISDADAPTADEMASAILDVIAYMFSYKDDQGEPINENARNFAVMVPVNMWAATLQACTKNNLNVGTGVRDNPLMSPAFNVEPVVNPRLSTDTVFYVFNTDSATKPFILQEEDGVKVDAIAEGSEEEFKNRRHLYGVSAIRNVGYGFWQHAAHCTTS